MSKKPPQSANFGRDLAGRARAICADAGRAAGNTALARSDAIHEIRRQLKRWRALLRLVAGPVGKQADRMSDQARTLMKSLATARDAQSALDALRDLEKSEVPVAKRSLKAMAARMTEVRDAAERQALTPAVRKELTDYFARATAALDRRPLATANFSDVTDRLTDTYRRARKLLPDDWRHAGNRRLHALRRRVVELRHQVDLLAHLWPRPADAWVNDAQRLRGRLGSCQDLAVLDAMADAGRPLSRWRSALAPAIAARRRVHLKAAARVAGRLFEDKPKRFHRRISALGDIGSARTPAVPHRPPRRQSR